MRNFQDGSFELLTRELEEMDPTLNSWKDYLVKSCRYLSRKRLFNCLYQMQIFLKVNQPFVFVLKTYCTSSMPPL